MNTRNLIFVTVLPLLALGAGCLRCAPRPVGTADPVLRRVVPPPAAPPVAVVVVDLRVADFSGTELGERLAAATPTPALGWDDAKQAAFPRDARAWMGACLSPTPDALQQAFETYQVQKPLSWTDAGDPAESWKVWAAGVRRMAFDDSRVEWREVPLDQPDAGERVVRRCSRRDAARPFLGAEIARRSAGVEVFLFGTAPNERVLDRFGTEAGGIVMLNGREPGDEPERETVRYGLLFAWNPERGQWVLIRNCLYDFPNSITGGPPGL